ncbi:MAG: manganese-dependent inorganic pyrophosphatase [Deltaproteobacteria bacterium]|jgi:manganese-dependent inorganic pyrophosphatase|nr:manganese-dependent inorganic pyrophosphatase [Deltaproteobacteria bacterium]
MSAVVVGHKNPDTDSIVSAIAAADLMSKRGVPSQPFCQGKIPPDTAFVLGSFGFPAPELLGPLAGKKVILVDHSDRGQAPEDLDQAELLGIFDHHKLGDITTSTPLFFWAQPVGCSCTVIKGVYDYYGVEIPRNIAGLMLCAILSDTLIFRSPTTTDEDRKAAKELARLAGVADYEALGMEMFVVKSAVTGVPARELLFRDYKDFTMNGQKVGVSQLEVVDIKLLDGVRADLRQAMTEAKAEGRHTIMLLLTDIMKEGSELLVLSDDANLAEKVFGAAATDTTYSSGNKNKGVWLPGVMSRKKDVVPKLEAVFK